MTPGLSQSPCISEAGQSGSGGAETVLATA